MSVQIGLSKSKINNRIKNKLKSLKVAQVKDEMDDDEDDGCDGLFDVVCLCCEVMLCGDVMRDVVL